MKQLRLLLFLLTVKQRTARLGQRVKDATCAVTTSYIRGLVPNQVIFIQPSANASRKAVDDVSSHFFKKFIYFYFEMQISTTARTELI